MNAPRPNRAAAALRVASSVLLLAALVTGCASTPPPPVRVKVIAINDFHGNLKPPLGGIRLADPADPGKTVAVPAGGAEYLASAVQAARAKNPNHVFVAAGDLVGASPLLSALFHDEPTIEALGLMGLEASAVGNHEFDQGRAELLRQQQGGCHPKDGCRGPNASWGGARFQYLAASTIDTATGRPLLPPYVIKRFEGIPVAFIGLTLKDTPGIVTPSGVAGLEFRDEVATVNALVPGLRGQGVEAIVVLIHEGGFPSGGPDECPSISGPIVKIVEGFDAAVDVVVSGHTHRAYNCRIAGRLVTSADKYGTVLSEIDLTIDRRSRDVVEARAANVVVRHDQFAREAAQTRLIATWEPLAAPLARRIVGRLSAPLTRDESPAGESTLGQVVADSQLRATEHPSSGGAQIALMNPGGLRADLKPGDDGQVRYEDVFAVQPFYNNLVTLSLSGAQLAQVLEQQWLNQPKPRMLQVSRGLSYQWRASAPVGQRVVPGSLRLHGEPIEPQRRYRVTVNSFLAAGGDGFTVLAQGEDRRTGLMDLDAIEVWFRGNDRVQPGRLDRIQKLD
ncbi:bifunctional metallophosphatase/5'-nucleotidase [Leptothrix discophora]|uniref:Bifunctional metallophosphatase/5'-nucleotidase n=1 Tax=Leptothrix discophora TaxID=89 RepID=A0ABT9G0F9_LEPDI|nr:bifunctional metallophosphatase/5'-nucleotidase [Leptothrix discophora]MDP4299968.1 bifunctional metallophosphatase/5'-nucleotidase [Leptothrix discophora]